MSDTILSAARASEIAKKKTGARIILEESSTRSHTWATESIDPKALQAAENRRAKPDSYTMYDADNNKYDAPTLQELADLMGVKYSQVICVVSQKESLT